MSTWNEVFDLTGKPDALATVELFLKADQHNKMTEEFVPELKQIVLNRARELSAQSKLEMKKRAAKSTNEVKIRCRLLTVAISHISKFRLDRARVTLLRLCLELLGNYVDFAFEGMVILLGQSHKEDDRLLESECWNFLIHKILHAAVTNSVSPFKTMCLIQQCMAAFRKPLDYFNQGIQITQGAQSSQGVESSQCGKDTKDLQRLQSKHKGQSTPFPSCFALMTPVATARAEKPVFESDPPLYLPFADCDDPFSFDSFDVFDPFNAYKNYDLESEEMLFDEPKPARTNIVRPKWDSSFTIDCVVKIANNALLARDLPVQILALSILNVLHLQSVRLRFNDEVFRVLTAFSAARLESSLMTVDFYEALCVILRYVVLCPKTPRIWDCITKIDGLLGAPVVIGIQPLSALLVPENEILLMQQMESVDSVMRKMESSVWRARLISQMTHVLREFSQIDPHGFAMCDFPYLAMSRPGMLPRGEVFELVDNKTPSISHTTQVGFMCRVLEGVDCDPCLWGPCADFMRDKPWLTGKGWSSLLEICAEVDPAIGRIFRNKVARLVLENHAPGKFSEMVARFNKLGHPKQKLADKLILFISVSQE